MYEGNGAMVYVDALLELLKELSVFKEGLLIGEIGNIRVYVTSLSTIMLS